MGECDADIWRKGGGSTGSAVSCIQLGNTSITLLLIDAAPLGYLNDRKLLASCYSVVFDSRLVLSLFQFLALPVWGCGAIDRCQWHLSCVRDPKHIARNRTVVFTIIFRSHNEMSE